jgi:hypothetical protein
MATGLVAFAVPGAPGVELVVNFGLVAGRSATPAEIDRLAERLLAELESVTIVAEERHELSRRSEATVHQVRIELGADRVPADAADRDALEARLLDRAEAWAEECAADRHLEP